MGYYVTLEAALKIDKPGELLFQIATDRSEGNPFRDLPKASLMADDGDYNAPVLVVLRHAFGDAAEGLEGYEEEWFFTVPRTRLYDQQNALEYLAAHGVTGTVEVEGEDGDRWRWDLKDGECLQVGGEFLYWDDPAVAAKDLLTKIDWRLLRAQKLRLLELLSATNRGPDTADGLVHLIDALQDFAVKELRIAEADVFGSEED